MKRIPLLVGLTAAATAAALAAVPTATAVTEDTLTSGLVGPLGLDVSDDGVYVAQSFIGSIDEVLPDGTLRNVRSGVDDPVGLAADGQRMVFTTTTYSDGGQGPVSSAKLRVVRNDGTVRTLANLLRFERQRNPDGRQRYGVLGVGRKCRAKLPPAPQGQPYRGIVDAHPYAVAEAPQGGWYVADAAGNDILHVRRNGRIRVVAVLEPQRLRITRAIAQGAGFPSCAVGHDFGFEPVPTDVEVLPGGNLLVSLLPGGPEDPSLGARGSVVKVGTGGRQTTVARGFLAATDLAVAPGGRVWVTELFGDRVSTFTMGSGNVHTFADLTQPAAVEYHDGKLYVAHNAFPPEEGPPNGTITVYDLSAGPSS